jgi:hypothetical protein
MTFWGVLGKVRAKIAERIFGRIENAHRKNIPTGAVRSSVTSMGVPTAIRFKAVRICILV